MRVVCLSNLGDSPGFVVRKVVEAFPPARIVQVQGVPRRTAWTRRLRSALLGGWLRRLEHRLYYRRYFEQGYARLDELLYGPLGVPSLAPVARIASTAVNHSSTATLLKSLRPDVLLVAGAPILAPRIFGIPRLAAINVHFGISPQYRGEHTLFWPVYYRDESRIGVTVHLIDKGIDTGQMLAQAFVGVEANDNQWLLEAKAARMAADLVIDVLQSGQFRPCWQPPWVPSRRAFNFNGRRIWHDAVVNWRRWRGERLSPTSARTVNYCRPVEDDALRSSDTGLLTVGVG